MSKPKDRKDWESWIDEQIREAQDRGDFDNLPGKGKPLNLASNPYAQDQELAFKVLKDAGYAPEWIELGKAIRLKLQHARDMLERRRAWYDSRIAELAGRSDGRAHEERGRVEASWRQAVLRFQEDADAINKEIRVLNLKVPSPQFQRPRVDVEAELSRIVDGAG